MRHSAHAVVQRASDLHKVAVDQTLTLREIDATPSAQGKADAHRGGGRRGAEKIISSDLQPPPHGEVREARLCRAADCSAQTER